MEFFLRFAWWLTSVAIWAITMLIYFTLLMVGLDWYQYNASRIFRGMGFSTIVYDVVSIPLALIFVAAIPLFYTALYIAQSALWKKKVFHE